MNQRTILVACTACAALACGPALAQPNAATVKVAAADTSACEKTVKDYLSTLRFVRQTSGSEISSRVESTYLSEAQVAQISQQQGACGAAQALRSKGVGAR